ncbi:hypothetical protein GCM10020358_48900 [Amorphoplanes nipponensis]|uniref:Uncharacterized protein n=1 Tax=Actinoplanes nipponensis TaxID=135950 RepID=A0A919MSJ0_9ACTN|nr:hypothetical protein Ani05nite_61570 [Actinoplanes nipponensis]
MGLAGGGSEARRPGGWVFGGRHPPANPCRAVFLAAGGPATAGDQQWPGSENAAAEIFPGLRRRPDAGRVDALG